MKKRLIWCIIVLLCAAMVGVGLLMIRNKNRIIFLTDLTPVYVEYGMIKDPLGFSKMVGPGKIDVGPWGKQNSKIWHNKKKIIKKEKKDYDLKGQEYRSAMPDVFSVWGEFVSGVGLWVKTRNMYYFIEYDIPKHAKLFTANLLVSDDHTGYNFYQGPKHQQFTWQVLIDGKIMVQEDVTRTNLYYGYGQKWADIKIAIPKGAKKIRFYLLNSPWGDTNNNTELIINKGTFSFK